jgi:hypothetical protein
VDATQSLPHKFVINTAYKAERKSYPIRWLIVVVSTFSVILLAIIFLGLFEIFSGKMGDNIKKKSTTERVI